MTSAMAEGFDQRAQNRHPLLPPPLNHPTTGPHLDWSLWDRFTRPAFWSTKCGTRYEPSAVDPSGRVQTRPMCVFFKAGRRVVGPYATCSRSQCKMADRWGRSWSLWDISKVEGRCRMVMVAYKLEGRCEACNYRIYQSTETQDQEVIALFS